MPQPLVDRARLPTLEILGGSQTIWYFYFPLADKLSSNLIGFRYAYDVIHTVAIPP